MAVAAAALAAGSSSPSLAASDGDFSIDKAFAAFMRDVGKDAMPESGAVGLLVQGMGSLSAILMISTTGMLAMAWPCECASHSAAVRWMPMIIPAWPTICASVQRGLTHARNYMALACSRWMATPSPRPGARWPYHKLLRTCQAK